MVEDDRCTTRGDSRRSSIGSAKYSRSASTEGLKSLAISVRSYGRLCGGRLVPALRLTPKRRLNPVGDLLGKFFRPLHDGLVGDANGLGCGVGVTAKKFESFGFAHAPLNHSSLPRATMVIGRVLSTRYCQKMAEEEMQSKTPYAERLAHAMSQSENPLTAVELAEAMGITRQAIDKLLKGGSKEMSASNNARAARLLNVDPTWLATGEGTARPAEFLVRWHERRLLELYRRLPPDEQDEFADLVESRCAIHEQSEGDAPKQTRTLPAPLQDKLPKAGTSARRIQK